MTKKMHPTFSSLKFVRVVLLVFLAANLATGSAKNQTSTSNLLERRVLQSGCTTADISVAENDYLYLKNSADSSIAGTGLSATETLDYDAIIYTSPNCQSPVTQPFKGRQVKIVSFWLRQKRYPSGPDNFLVLSRFSATGQKSGSNLPMEATLVYSEDLLAEVYWSQ